MGYPARVRIRNNVPLCTHALQTSELAALLTEGLFCAANVGAGSFAD